eukprot:TRINITY_DN1274_c2_g1_i5.p1 TRINITY_DN1274_c2_g1~~TRINITY_DN1274_c2_g1_i5.p1  ORF type:complete len:240 (+),score=79.71 TRINITY_DN1274_c2_g1_i5:423-1142(+)
MFSFIVFFFSTDFCEEMIQVIKDLEADKSVQGMVLTSNLNHIFSGGIDIFQQLVNPTKEDFDAFIKQFFGFFVTLYTSPLVISNSIPGHNPAGGCVMSMACDYRVMVNGPYEMGLNEVPVGVAVPSFIYSVYASVIGARKAELYLKEGRMLSPEEALAVELVDELASDPQDGIAKASAYVERMIKLPNFSRTVTKVNIRTPFAKTFQGELEASGDLMYQAITSKETQATIAHIVKSMGK